MVTKKEGGGVSSNITSLSQRTERRRKREGPKSKKKKKYRPAPVSPQRSKEVYTKFQARKRAHTGQPGLACPTHNEEGRNSKHTTAGPPPLML